MLLPKESYLSHKGYNEMADKLLIEKGDELTTKELEAIAIFKHCDLECAYNILASSYSLIHGRAARDPMSMTRSWLYRVFRKMSETEFVDELRHPNTAIICGFTPGDVPGIGTFADFDKRLWGKSNKNESEENVKDKMIKPDKPKEDGEKAPSVEKESVGKKIERYLGEDASALDELPFQKLYKLFQKAALEASIRLGVVGGEILSGDGTPIVTSNRERSNRACPMNPEGKHECLCKGKDKDAACPFKSGPDQARPCEADEWKDKRYYSQPDTAVGFDSSRKNYYSGYDLYMITDTRQDAPLFPMLNRASMHDSHGFVECIMRMAHHFPDFHPRYVLLDSAHDVDPIYQLIEQYGAGAVIDLNTRGADQVRLPDGFGLDENNIPVCPKHAQLVRTGTDKKAERAIFQCPKMRPNAEGKCICTCDTPCEKSKKSSRISVPLALLPENLRVFKKKVQLGFTIGEDGVPVCPEGLKMSPLGKDKFRCPLMVKLEGGTVACTCKVPCSKAKNGRTIALSKEPQQPSDNTADPTKEITFAKDGTPICRDGIRMTHNGNNHQRNSAMFRCGLASRSADGSPICTCENPCSSSVYGKNVTVPRTENLRFYTDPPRQSEEWDDIYKLRIASERCNKVVKEDMGYGKVKHRSTMMWYIDLFGVMILIHVRKQLAAIAESASGVPQIGEGSTA